MVDKTGVLRFLASWELTLCARHLPNLLTSSRRMARALGSRKLHCSKTRDPSRYHLVQLLQLSESKV